jgi:hypothetical protein
MMGEIKEMGFRESGHSRCEMRCNTGQENAIMKHYFGFGIGRRTVDC